MAENTASTIIINKREEIKINGVESVKQLNETDACVVVSGDELFIKGENLRADKLSVETGELVLNGKINSIKFEEKREKQGLLKRILK